LHARGFLFNWARLRRKTAAEVIYQVSEDRTTKEQRTTAKPCNFGFLYGQQVERFKDYAMTWGVRLTLAEAEILSEQAEKYETNVPVAFRSRRYI
jgi:DNA polymerase I-like protein with 3'-5' exonuclease and polymerase domains